MGGWHVIADEAQGMIVALCLAGIALAGAPAAAQEAAESAALRALAETRAFVAASGDSIWPGYATAPFGIVLVEPDREVLLCDERLPDGFSAAGQEALTGCPMALGPSSWRTPQLQSAMPVFGPPSVIVVGHPETVGLDSAEWQMMILHEHFHQWQSDLPEYYRRVAALGLAGGDETGMWMLNYPFPYREETVADRFASARDALLAAHAAIGTTAFEARVEDYLAHRGALARSVSEQDWRYAEFQLWQEGIARWTEIAIARLHPDPAVRAAAERREKRTLTALAAASIADHERLVFYALGAVEGLVLEHHRPAWREAYVNHLATGPLFR